MSERPHELNYTTGEVRVSISREIPKLYAAGNTYEGLKPGSVISVPRWVAEKLVALGVANYMERGIDLATLAQIEWRERKSVSELTELPQRFYVDAKHLIKQLQSSSPDNARQAEARLRDILSIRSSKILSMASKLVAVDKIKNMAPEEITFYLRVRRVLEEWFREIGLHGD